MNAEQIARALGGCTRGTSGWWNAKCPAHQDGKASLGLKDADDGGVAWKCLAGCDGKAVRDALKSRGLLPERRKAEPARKSKVGRRIVATYDYVDPAGALVLQVVRYDPKDFRQRRPDPAKPGGWLWTIGDLCRPLYRLPELLAADPTEPVFVVEGEKDVDRLRSLGLVATTSSQGADGWSKTDHAALAGRRVVILPDNDESGRKYRDTAARDLAGKAASLRVVELPDLPPKGDVSDWLDKGGTAEELRRLAAEAPEFTPGEEQEPDEEREPEAADDFDRWNEALHRTDRGEARDIIHNVAIILRKDARFAGRLRWNAMLEAAEATGLPWCRARGWAPWTEADDLFLADWCQKRHVYVKRPICAAAVQLVARDQVHHPVRERLGALVWDGTPRLDTWLSTYLGAAVEAGGENPVAKRSYMQQVGRRFLVSAVARVFQPGCKADHALILEGPQGVGKSTAARILSLDDGFFADEISDLGSKDSAQDLRGKWLVELAELSAMRRGEIERAKAFISRSVDHYRPNYGVRSQDFPRQCVFIGSTNADAYLADETGGRRFWPVKVGAIDLAALRRDVEQLWAEAVAAFKAGERWWLDAEVERAAREEQEERRVGDPWEWRVLQHCVGKVEVTMTEIIDDVLAIPSERQSPADMKRVAGILRGAGWKQVQKRVHGTRTRLYVRAEADPPGTEGEASTRDSDASARATRDEEPSVSAVGTAGTADFRTCAQARARTHAHALEVSRHGCGSRATRDTPPPWDDLDGWRARLKWAQGWSERTATILAWGQAAGGTVDTTDEVIRLQLPADLPSCFALAELRWSARGLGLLP